MKRILYLAIIAILGMQMYACNSGTTQNQTTENKISANKVEVYYFHHTRRCATCQAVEDVSKIALEELYAEQIKNGKLAFTTVNIDKEENSELAESLEVSGQSLIIVLGDKKVDITNEAFMHARSNPEKLKEKLQSVSNELLSSL